MLRGKKPSENATCWTFSVRKMRRKLKTFCSCFPHERFLSHWKYFAVYLVVDVIYVPMKSGTVWFVVSKQTAAQAKVNRDETTMSDDRYISKYYRIVWFSIFSFYLALKKLTSNTKREKQATWLVASLYIYLVKALN